MALSWAGALFVAALACCQSGGQARQVPLHWGTDDYARIMHPYHDPISEVAPPYEPMRAAVQPLEAADWVPTLTLGEVVGVAVDRKGDPVVLHRGGRVWEPRSFNESHQMGDNTRLPHDTVVTLDQYSAQQKDAWGAGTFLMPHGITIDTEGDIWITDVGLHQVIKFSGVNHHPLLTLGEAEVPGTDERHFCQPTSAAVSHSGDVFVADGYCNNRVMRFTADGDFVGQFGSTGTASGLGAAALHLPHGIALVEPLDALCLADREGRRVACYRAGLRDEGRFGALVASVPEVHGRRVFDVAALDDGTILGVGGSAAEGSFGVAFTADITSASVLGLWRPRQGLHNPHAIAVAPDGAALYIAEMAPNTVWKFVVSPY